MRKFWKIGLIFGIVAFMAGCSNLWDYQPPKSNNPKPGNPTDQTPPPQLNQKTLTFRVIDGTGEEKSVTVQVPETSNSVPIGQIKAAFKTQYPNSSIPEGWEEDGEWYESDLTQKATGNYSDGALFAIGLKPKQVGYTSSITTAGGGKRDYLTNVDWNNQPQPLSKILETAGIAPGADNEYTPSDEAAPATGWTFKHWAKADAPDTPLDPNDSTTYDSGTNFVAVYEVEYTITVRGQPYTVKVPVAAPNTGATWEQILDAAKGSSSPLSDTEKADLDDLIWKDGDGNAPSEDSEKQYPANTTFTGSTALSFNVNGNVVTVADENNNGQATWEKIKAAAIAQYGEDAINNPAVPSSLAGGVFAEWQTDGAVAGDTTSYPANSVFNPAFEVSYSISNGYTRYEYKEKVLAGTNTNKTLSDIFDKVNADNSNTVPSDGSTVVAKDVPGGGKVAFDGWRVTTPDGVTKIVHSSEIAGMTTADFPAGTKIKPNGTYQLIIDKGWDTDGVGMEFTWFEGSATLTQIGDFYIANTEITREQWKKVMSKEGLTNEWKQKDGTTQWNKALETTAKALDGSAATDQMKAPMDRISWYDTLAFCNWLSELNGRTPYYSFEYEGREYSNTDFITELYSIYTPTYSDGGFYPIFEKIKVKWNEDTDKPGFRIPTSDYWRYAAHGGDKVDGKYIYPKYSGTTGSGTADLDNVAWYNKTGGMHVVGLLGGDNPLRDMSGNVSEWCWDEYWGGTHLYIGGTYNTGEPAQRIDAMDTPGAYGIINAMFGQNSTTGGKYWAGRTGDRDTQGMRIIVPGRPGENYEDYFD